MRILIEGKIQNMASSDLLNFVDPDALKKAKEKDPHPTLKAFVIAHEGESKSHFVGWGEKALTWFKNAVNKVYDVLKIGTPVFSGHNSDNSTDGRTKIGEVIGKFQNVVNGINRVVSIIQIYNPFKTREFDIASFEGDIILPNSFDNTVRENDLKDISGIALAEKSLGDQPAFPGATLEAAVQMLENGGKKVKLSEVMKLIEENKWSPSELFTDEQLIAAEPVKKALESAEAKVNNQGAAFKRLNATIEKNDTKLKAKDDKINELNIKLMNKDSRDVFKTAIEERKIEDPKLKQFIELRQSKFNISDHEADIKVEVNKHIDKSVEEYKTEREFFIDKKEEKKEDQKGQLNPDYIPPL